MALSDIERTAILRAASEFDQLSRDEFLKRNGFRQSRSYFLRLDEKLYDSKAIVGVVHGYSGGGRRALAASEFTGGEATVAQLLRSLGFDVQVSAAPSNTDNRMYSCNRSSMYNPIVPYAESDKVFRDV